MTFWQAIQPALRCWAIISVTSTWSTVLMIGWHWKAIATCLIAPGLFFAIAFSILTLAFNWSQRRNHDQPPI